MAKLTAKERKILAATLMGEARGEGKQGMAAVAWVIRNRSNDPRWPNNPAAVALQKGQFSANNNGLFSADTKSKEYKAALEAIDEVFEADTSADPTRGALHYYANEGPNAVPEPSWFSKNAKAGDTQIGRHRFASTMRTEDQLTDIGVDVPTDNWSGDVYAGGDSVFSPRIRMLLRPDLQRPRGPSGRGRTTGTERPTDLTTRKVTTTKVDINGNPIWTDDRGRVTRDPSKPLPYPGGGEPRIIPGGPLDNQPGDLGVRTPNMTEAPTLIYRPDLSPAGPMFMPQVQTFDVWPKGPSGRGGIRRPPDVGTSPAKYTEKIVTERVPTFEEVYETNTGRSIATPQGPQGRGSHRRRAAEIIAAREAEAAPVKKKVQTGWKTVKKVVRVQEPTKIVPKVQLTRTLTGKVVPVGSIITTQGGTRRSIVRADGIIVDAKTGKDIAASVRQHFINAGDFASARRVQDKRRGPLSFGSKTQRTQSSQGETAEGVWAEAKGF